MKKPKKEPIPSDVKSYIKAITGTVGLFLSCLAFVFVGIFNQLWMNWILGVGGFCLFIVSMVLFTEGWFEAGQNSIKNRDD